MTGSPVDGSQPVSTSPLHQALQALSTFCVGDATLQATLQRVADLSLAALPSADAAGLTMLLGGQATTAAFTDERAPKIDSAQYETGVGPCLDAFRHKQVYRIDDVKADQQWPAFSEAAAAHGFRSVMSVPLVARHEGVGALNLYSRTVAAFSRDDVEVGIAFATPAALLLANSQAYWDAEQLGEDIGAATHSRAVIEQAKGVLMGVHGCGADEAFEILVRGSQRDNRTLREIAEELVARPQQSHE